VEKLFYPESIAIIGLSSKASNIPKLVLENLIRWGYLGRIFGVNPNSSDIHVSGIKMYRNIHDLPIVPDLAFALVPARFVPAAIEDCGRFGIKRMAIPSGGFNELGEEGKKLSGMAVKKADEYGIRFVGPNGVTVANTENGLCLPFVPSYMPSKGGLSIITQSGGVGLMLWNLIADEDIGMAKFASIGNKLNMDEVDFLEYFGRDPATKVICLYLESMTRGRDFMAAADKIDKPIIVLKSNTTEAGKKAAMSHTAAMSSNDDIINNAFERYGIIRINSFSEFISVSKVFQLPPMKGKKMMVMSPAGGFTVMMADLCEKLGFEFADPGIDFFDSLKEYSNAGVINFSNPLDMGDIYDPKMYAHIFYSVMHNENVDGAVFVSQWPHMPKGEDVFYRMFHTDLSKEATGTLLSSGKPLGICLFGLSKTISEIKKNINFPIFNNAEEMIFALKKQHDYYVNKSASIPEYKIPAGMNQPTLKEWIEKRNGIVGEESLELMDLSGIPVARSELAVNENESVKIAGELGYPVVMKVASPDAVHKSEAGGVITGIMNDDDVVKAFTVIKENLFSYKKNAEFQGVRIMQTAGDGYDFFIGGNYDESFGPVVFFGYGGIYIEIFRDIQCVLCPSDKAEIKEKLSRLRSYSIIKGARGKTKADIDGYVDMIEKVSYLMAEFPKIKELDLNPVRLLSDGSGVLTLDARLNLDD